MTRLDKVVQSLRASGDNEGADMVEQMFERLTTALVTLEYGSNPIDTIQLIRDALHRACIEE